MRTLMVGWAVVGALAGTLLPSGSLKAQGAQDEAVLEVVTRLFDGMREKDEAKLRSVFHPDARLHTAMMDQAGQPVTRESAIEGFITNVAGAKVHIDEVTFDEVVHVDGNLAMAWTPYNVFVDGAFQHCGVDVFVMTMSDEGWKILQLADTRHQEGCDPERRD
jgi:hypothetical protein